MGTFDNIIAMKAEYTKKIQDEGKELLKSHFAAFFEAHPEVMGIRWTQYTPYFNDGDPCEFTVHEFTAKAGGEEGMEEDGYDYVYGEKSWQKSVRELEAIPEDVMEAVFGDHVRVTATRAGFEVEEYDHD